MEEALIALLLRSEQLQAIVGSRIYWGRAPQGIQVPYIVLQVISGPRDYTGQGASGYIANRVQQDVYAKTYSTSKRAARAACTALSGRRTGKIQGVFIEAERDLPATDAGEVANLFRTSVDFMIHHSY